MHFRSEAACIAPVKTPFEQKSLELLRDIEQYGDIKLTLDLLRLLSAHFIEEAETGGYPQEPED
jgi:hypothetical protein